MKDSKRPPRIPRESGRPPATGSGRPHGLPQLNADDDGGTDSHSGATETSLAIVDILSDAPREALTVVMGADEGRVFPITLQETWIGRASDCSVVINDRGVSRHHACIVHEGSHVFVRDNDAKNGTFVNNRRASRQELQPGDEIQLGPNVCLVFAHEKVGEHHSARDRLFAAKMKNEKVESIASMVAGVAHEINTPLGVANAANAMITTLAEEVRRNPSSERIDELVADLKASAGLVTKNLERASNLVRAFKQLSAREPFDEKVKCDLAGIVQDCVEAVRAEAVKQKVTISIVWPSGIECPWVGFQGSMTRVLAQLLQNSLLHAFPNGDGGKIEIRVLKKRKSYTLEFEDDGVGIDPTIVPRVFEPFVTAGREKGTTGLGLAIVHNLMTNVLGGAISFTSQKSKGTRFVLKLPTEVPEPAD